MALEQLSVYYRSAAYGPTANKALPVSIKVVKGEQGTVEAPDTWFESQNAQYMDQDEGEPSEQINVFPEGTAEENTNEVGVFALNALALTISNDIIPELYTSYIATHIHTKRDESDENRPSVLWFLCRPLILVPKEQSFTVNACKTPDITDTTTGKTQRGTDIYCVHNLKCNIVATMFDANYGNRVLTKDKLYQYDTASQKGPDKAEIATTMSNFNPLYKEDLEDEPWRTLCSVKRYATSIENRASDSDTYYGTYYKDIEVILHDVIFVRRRDVVGTKLFSLDGLQLKDAKGITVNFIEYSAAFPDGTIINSIVKPDFTFSIEQDAARDTQESLGEHIFDDGKYERCDIDIFKTVSEEKRKANRAQRINRLFSHIGIVPKQYNNFADSAHTIDELSIAFRTADTVTGKYEGMPDSDYEISSNSNSSAIQIVLGNYAGKGQQIPPSGMKRRANTTETTARLTQIQATASMFGSCEIDSDATKCHVNIHLDVFVNDYFSLKSGQSISEFISAPTTMKSALSLWPSNDTTSPSTTIDLAYEDITVDALASQLYYALLPKELQQILRCEAKTGVSKFNVDGTVVTDPAATAHMPDLTEDTLQTTIDMYNALTNVEVDKSGYRTPMEYYGQSSNSSDITLFDNDRLTSTSDTITSDEVPTYFWVETLKNWCYFTTVSYDDDNKTATEAKLLVWNGLNGWYDLCNLLSYSKQNFVSLDVLKNLSLDSAEDNETFKNFSKYLFYRLQYYQFPLENLHTVDIDRLYYPCDPDLKGKSRSFWERQWDNIKKGVGGMWEVAQGMWETVTSVTAIFTDEDFGEKWLGGWKKTVLGYAHMIGAVIGVPGITARVIWNEVTRSEPNPEFYSAELDKNIYARCYYLKLPYDSNYSANDPATYQTIRVQHRAEKAYGGIDGGMMYGRVNAQMFNVIPTTIGSPFVTRSSTGELMIAYRMMHTGPIKQDKDEHHDMIKFSGIMPIDAQLSNQLLQTRFGQGTDKTINDWLNVFGESSKVVASNMASAATTNLSTSVTEQVNLNTTACGKMIVTSNRSKTTTETDTATINTLVKW